MRTPEAQQAAHTVLLVATHSHMLQAAAVVSARRGRMATRKHSKTLAAPAMPVEMWHEILKWCDVWELGARR